MAEFDPENIRAVQASFLKQLGVTNKEAGIELLKDTIKRSDGKMKKTFENMLIVLQADI